MKLLVVNADDFGFSPGVNQGIIKAHTEGIVTSASLMVHGSAASEAAGLSAFPDLSLGLHFQIVDKELEKAARGTNDGAKSPFGRLTDDQVAVIRQEFIDQLALFAKITGRPPTHLDSHHHVIDHVQIRPIVEAYVRVQKIPVRRFGFARFERRFFGWGADGTPDSSRVSAEALLDILDTIDEPTELMSHPGFVDEALRQTGDRYLDEREWEVAALTDPRVRGRLAENDIRLMGWTAAYAATR